MKITQVGLEAPIFGELNTERIDVGIYRINEPNVVNVVFQLVNDEINSFAKVSKITDTYVELITGSFYNGGFTLSDDILQNGSSLELTYEPNYTDNELSAISHAQSILYRAGLKELALSIGAPRPKKP